VEHFNNVSRETFWEVLTMLDGYHRTFNNAALRFMSRPIDIPDMDLGVGDAENLRPQPIRFSYLPPERTPLLTNFYSVEANSPKQAGKQVTINDTVISGYIGELYGGLF